MQNHTRTGDQSSFRASYRGWQHPIARKEWGRSHHTKGGTAPALYADVRRRHLPTYLCLLLAGSAALPSEGAAEGRWPRTTTFGMAWDLGPTAVATKLRQRSSEALRLFSERRAAELPQGLRNLLFPQGVQAVLGQKDAAGAQFFLFRAGALVGQVWVLEDTQASRRLQQLTQAPPHAGDTLALHPINTRFAALLLRPGHTHARSARSAARTNSARRTVSQRNTQPAMRPRATPVAWWQRGTGAKPVAALTQARAPRSWTRPTTPFKEPRSRGPLRHLTPEKILQSGDPLAGLTDDEVTSN